MPSVRIDKWLWAARFFKTRALAARACELGRIQSNGQPAKPAREVRIGDKLKITNDGGEFHVEVLLLSEVRGPASVARRSIARRKKARKRGSRRQPSAKQPCSLNPCHPGRPSKRDRRKIIQFRGRGVRVERQT